MWARLTPGPSKPSPIKSCLSVAALMFEPVGGLGDGTIVLSGRIADEAMFFDLGYEAGSSSGFYGVLTGGSGGGGKGEKIREQRRRRSQDAIGEGDQASI